MSDWIREPWLNPVLEQGVARYIVDLKLQHFRQLSSPYEAIEFESQQGRELCTAAGIVTCCQCESSAMVANRANVHCPRCGSVIGTVGASVSEPVEVVAAVGRVVV